MSEEPTVDSVLNQLEQQFAPAATGPEALNSIASAANLTDTPSVGAALKDIFIGTAGLCFNTVFLAIGIPLCQTEELLDRSHSGVEEPIDIDGAEAIVTRNWHRSKDRAQSGLNTLYGKLRS